MYNIKSKNSPVIEKLLKNSSVFRQQTTDNSFIQYGIQTVLPESRIKNKMSGGISGRTGIVGINLEH